MRRARVQGSAHPNLYFFVGKPKPRVGKCQRDYGLTSLTESRTSTIRDVSGGLPDQNTRPGIRGLDGRRGQPLTSPFQDHFGMCKPPGTSSAESG
jgi:hypothetical protein